MQLTHTGQTDRTESGDTSDDRGRRLGRYLLFGGVVLAAIAVFRRQRARRRKREMTTIEIRDDPATANN